MSEPELWTFIAEHPTDTDVRRALERLERVQMSRIFHALLDARAALVDSLVQSGRASDASEDTLDDLAESILLSGKARYDAVLSGNAQLPPREQWGPERAVVSLFDEAYHRRFGGGILDDVD